MLANTFQMYAELRDQNGEHEAAEALRARAEEATDAAQRELGAR